MRATVPKPPPELRARKTLDVSAIGTNCQDNDKGLQK